MRFYKDKLPAKHDLVLVEVKEITADVSRVYVNLLEYDNITAFLQFKFWSRKWLDPAVLQSQIRRAKTFVVAVGDISEETGEIETVKGTVKPEDAEAHQQIYNRGKAIYSIMRQVASKTDKDIEYLYEKIAWPLDENSEERSLGSYNGLRSLIGETKENIQAKFEIDEKTTDELLKAINHFLNMHKINIRAEFNLWCRGIDGIIAIKNTIKAGLALSTEAVPFEIHLKSSPTYTLTAQVSSKPDEALVIVRKALKVMETKINEYQGGEMKVSLNHPKVHVKGKKDKSDSLTDGEDGFDYESE